MDAAPCTARRFRRRAAIVIVCAACVGAARAQPVERAPNPVGFPVGPVIIAPSLTAGYAYDSNVFLRPSSENPTSDQVLTLQPAFFLTVPFSNSSFRFGDTLRYTDYAKTVQTNGKLSNDATADLNLRFGSLDELILSAHNIAGVAETLAFDPGGEVSFAGKSYKLHSEALLAKREVVGARGYRVGLTRNALRFDPGQEIFFFNYRGFDGEASYLEPMSSNTHLSFGYLGARYDHFDISPGADPYAVFRTEAGDTFFAAIEGRLSPRQPYNVSVGWERLSFTGNDYPDFSGIVVRANASFIVGGGTTIATSLSRQPYRSFFTANNFYVSDQVYVGVLRDFEGIAVVGVDASVSRSRYRAAVPAGEPSAGTVRSDQAFSLEAYANLTIRERVIFRLSVSETRKNSNYPGADYDATTVFGGFIFGWF